MSRLPFLVKALLVAIVPACCAEFASAQLSPAAPAIDSLVITAARWPQPASELVADVTVIGPEEIARAGAQSLAEVLRRVPGVEIVMNGGPASTSGVFLRGANSNQTLVLIDGHRVGSSTSGTAALEAIPMDAIDHIEILRGPASNLYGADAIGGVIQVFTRNGGEAFTAHATAGYGTYRTGAISGGVSGIAGAWRYALDVGHKQSAGFNAIDNPANFSFNDDRDGYRGDDVSGSVSLRLAPEQELSARFLKSRLNAQFDAEPTFDDRTITTVDSYALASRNRLTAWWTSRLDAGRTDDISDSRTGFGPGRFTTRQRLYVWQNEFLLPRGSLGAALERREERVGGDAAFAVNSRDTNAAVGVYRLAEGPHFVQLNLRRDDSTQFGARTTGALAYGYGFAPGWRASASYGTAFKAPTFNDLYYPGFSNPELKPETARNAELALRYASDAFAAGLVAYRNRVRELIVFECDADFNCAPQNVAAATLEGVTLDMRFRLGSAAATASIDLQRPEDDASGLLLPRRARRHAALAVEHPLGSVQFRAELIASSARFDDAANTRRMGGYALVNLLVEWPFEARWTAFARLDNLLDKHYELAADYHTAGANLFAGVRWRY
ncbi:MAG TPA: TonB-dependent receptor [Casimicrobiaceae bacterium]|nr:TonB-dependent receptor [Casimicrobiaceae bacterium]